MKFPKSILTGTGAVVLAGLILALLATKAAHAVAATLVQVTNTAANPVVVQDVDSAGRQPFAVTSPTPPTQGPSVTLPALTSGGGVVQTVVIEFVSAVCSGNPGQTSIGTPSLFVNLGGSQHDYFLPSIFQGNFSNSSAFAVAQQATIYADPGSTVFFGMSFLNTGCIFTLSGHLVQ
jgi:hypothetical protein